MRRRAARLAILGGMLLAGGCAEPPRPPVVIAALPAPEGGEPAFEPHLAIDPDNPEHVIVAAQYGIGYNRGGRKIWHWTTGDGGATWNGSTIPLPRADAVLAADAVTAFDTESRPLIGFLFADSSFRGGAAMATGAPRTVDLGPVAIVVPDQRDLNGGAVDKIWMAIDKSPTSPFRGSRYLSWHYNRPMPDRTVESTLWIERRQGDRRFEPTRVAGNFAGQIAVRSTGVLDVLYSSLDEGTLLHVASEDGGKTFSPADTIVRVADSLIIDASTILVIPGDTIVVCWSEGVKDRSTGIAVGCRRGSGNGGWDSAARIEAPPKGSFGFPALAVNQTAVWLLGYRSDSVATTVELLKSSDGARTFSVERVLGTRGFGNAGFCPAPSAPCRRDTTAFFGGDYFGLAASADRIVAAFTLPADDTPVGRSTVYLATVRP